MGQPESAIRERPQHADQAHHSDGVEPTDHSPILERDLISPSPHDGVSDLAFGRPSGTTPRTVDELQHFAQFAAGSYGATTTIQDLDDAQHGDVIAMLGVLGLAPGGALAKLAATIGKTGKLLSRVLKAGMHARHAGKAAQNGLVWTHGQVPATLVKAAEKRGNDAVQVVDEYGWRLEEQVERTAREVPVPGSVTGEMKKVDLTVITSTLFDENGAKVVSGVFEGPLWQNHPINALSGIDAPQRARTAVLLDHVPGEKRLALQPTPKRPEPITSHQQTPHHGQPSPYSSNPVPTSAASAIARALHPKFAYDLTRILQADMVAGGSPIAGMLQGILLRFSQPIATLQGVARASSARITRNSALPEGLEVWITSQQTTMIFEILPRDVDDFVATIQRFLQQYPLG